MSKRQGPVTAPYYTPPKTTSAGGTLQTGKPVQPASVAARTSVLKRRRVFASLWEQARKTYKGQAITLAIVGILLAVSTAIFTSSSLSSSASNLDTIANGSIPSVDAAQALGQYIADIDAKAADYLATASLTGIEPCTLVGLNTTSTNVGNLTVHDCDKRNIDTEIILTNKEIFDAAHNVTYPGERTSVERITAGFEEYTADLTLMENEYTLSQSGDPTVHLRNAYNDYLAASKVVHEHINRQAILDESGLPTCTTATQIMLPNVWVNGSIEDNINCLSWINKSHLDQGYNATMSSVSRDLWLSGALCVLFCGLLAYMCWRIARTTHRLFTFGLLLALLVGLIVSSIVVSFMGSLSGMNNTADARAHGAYVQLVKDDYASVYAADQLQRFGTDANADESRWLIALAFNDQQSARHWSTDWLVNTQHVRELMLQAQDNQTWSEEKLPLRDMSTNWTNYYQIDGTIRSTANNTIVPTHINDAEKLSTGASNRSFSAFSDAVNALREANYTHYNATLGATQQGFRLYIPFSAILFPLIALAAIWGITQRLKKF